jgi:hypothetical protein
MARPGQRLRYPRRVAKKKAGTRQRTLDRALERKRQKLHEARVQLARLEPGGSPERPLEVSSASVVQSRAESEPCLRCNGAMRCAEHGTAEGSHGLLRLVELSCRSCGETRRVYLRIVGSLLN